MTQQYRIRLPMQETQVWFLNQKDPLEKEMATHFSIFAGKSHGQGAWQATIHEVSIESDMI